MTAAPTIHTGNGLRVIAILCALMAIVTAPVIGLLGMMAASDNGEFSLAFNFAIFGALYSIIGTVIGVIRTWRETGNAKWTIFLLFSWLIAVGAFVLALMTSGG